MPGKSKAGDQLLSEMQLCAKRLQTAFLVAVRSVPVIALRGAFEVKGSLRISNYLSTTFIVAWSAILACPVPVLAATFAGTGFFVTPDGYFLTCFHAVDGAHRITLRTVDGSMFDAAVVAVDRSNDLAVLKANGNFSPLAIDDAAAVKRGTAVLTIGFPHPAEDNPRPRRMPGVISSPAGLSTSAAAFQTTVSVPAGNCGAPVVTRQGNVVGMAATLDTVTAPTSAGHYARGGNNAIKSSVALALLNGISQIRNKLAKPSPKRFADTSALARSVEKAVAIVNVDADRYTQEEQATEKEQAERLRRSREQQEARRTESARKLEADQARQREADRLRTAVMNLEQRESSLHHEVMSTQHELDSVSRDSANHSALARRSELEHQLNYLQNQLNQTTTSKQGAMNQLNQLQLR